MPTWPEHADELHSFDVVEIRQCACGVRYPVLCNPSAEQRCRKCQSEFRTKVAQKRKELSEFMDKVKSIS